MSDEIDLQTAFATAAKLLNKEGFAVNTRFYPYAGLKGTIKLHDGAVYAKISDGYKAAGLEALTGLAIDLMRKLFRIRNLDKTATKYVEAYEGLNGKGVYDLHETLRGERGRRRKGSSQGRQFDLDARLDLVIAQYPEVFGKITKPTIVWSAHSPRRRLAFYDSAFGQIVVSRKFDSPSTPEFFLDYLVFHELLHAKHDPKYGSRRRVHHREFKEDERKFRDYGDAQEFMKMI